MIPDLLAPALGGASAADEALDWLMPMHLRVDADGTLRHAGPTIQKMMGETVGRGSAFLDVFEVHRPADVTGFADLMAAPKIRMSLALKSVPDLCLRATLALLPGRQGALIDFSLGLSFARGVRDFSLTLRDFSPCDQTVELLYLHEANRLTATLSRHLTERLQAAHAAAEFQARTDVLTGLANRRCIDAELTRLLAEQDEEFSILQLDLDHFKSINDTHGHAAGDAVLAEVGRIFREELRRNDKPARIGGDEFLIILKDTIEPAVAGRVASRLIKRIETPVLFNGIECRVSASIGVVTTAQYAERPTLPEMVADADAALYHAKKDGRGCFRTHSLLDPKPGDDAGASD